MQDPELRQGLEHQMHKLDGITDATGVRGLPSAHLAALGQMSESVASLNSRLIESVEGSKALRMQPQATFFR